MKKKIITSFLVLFLLFFAGIAITLYIVNKTTANLNALLTLHKVEIIRQDLVINVQVVQSNLYTTGTQFGKELDIIVDNVITLRDRVQSCQECHHEPDVAAGIQQLAELTEHYKEALSYFITSTADPTRIERLQTVAAGIGDSIIELSQQMALTANEALRRKTTSAMRKVANSKVVLWSTLGFALLVVVGVTMFLIRGITVPIDELLRATRRIRSGELGYVSRYRGRDEFGELVASFNEMSLILEQNHQNILAHMTRSQTILQTTTDGYLMVDGAGKVLDSNPALCEMVGLSRDEIKNRAVEDMFVVGIEVKALLGRIRATGSLLLQADLRNRLGKLLPVEISASSAELEGKQSYFIFVRDISERKKMEAELLKGQKLESLGVLAGGIAHDFNNLLTGITGYIDLALRTLVAGEKNHGWLESAKKASARAQALTQQLLTFSRGGEPVKTVVSIKELIDESVRFALSGSKVRCDSQLPGNLWPIHADKGQIAQVIQNIILNAAQAMPEGGTIKVSAVNEVIDAGHAGQLEPGRYVKMVFVDHGAGIAKKDLERVFDPYFTTKQTGNGLGLTICHSIIGRHHGHIGVESELGVGTTFTIYLPATGMGAAKTEAKVSGPIRGQGKVLVMDDEEHVRSIVGEMLRFLGYEPAFARDGQQALEMYKAARESGAPYAVVIMDLTIPGGMGGKEAITQLLAYDPGARAIVSSGYSNDPIMSDSAAHGFKGVASKPFDTEELSRILHETITS